MKKIDKGIPLPEKRYPRSKYPWDLMEVGDSFELDCKKGANTIAFANKRYAPRKFTSRRMNNGEIRVWRIA